MRFGSTLFSLPAGRREVDLREELLVLRAGYRMDRLSDARFLNLFKIWERAAVSSGMMTCAFAHEFPSCLRIAS